MILLALDTTLASCSAALWADGQIVASERQLMERGHAEAIAPIVTRVMDKAGLGYGDLTAIAVTTGPGTFTGIRIGLALAKGLALASGVKLIGLTSLQAVAVPLFGQGQDIIVCHAAGASGQFYVQRFRANGEAASDCQLLRPEEITLPDNAVLVGTGSQTVAEGRRVAVDDLPDAATFAAFAAMQPTVTAQDLQPYYVRPPDAKPRAQPRYTQPLIMTGRVGPEAAPLLAALHARSFDQPWGASSFTEMLAVPGTLALLAHRGDVPAGFILVRTIAGEAEILTLATEPSARRSGIASRLLEAAYPFLQALKAEALFLEVAADNDAALELYARQNFIRSGLRKAYYARVNGAAVDAILMRRDLR
jgi:tRNA threonylcarbamoyl adenosine modification protein YeaZ